MSKIDHTVYTIGHSTRTAEDFIALLKIYKVEMVVDVRTIAGSRYNPQYNEEPLKNTLLEQDISYVRMAGLGGLRHTTKNSINMAWKNKSFRGYADYMQTPEFAENIKELIKLAEEKRIVIMCAEAVPWRCHRSLIGDALVVRKIKGIDIINGKNTMLHKITPFAQIKSFGITYPSIK